MAVISELIDAGLSLKEQGNHQAAIEHFRQLNVTYPDHARIMFELAGSWQAFGVPEQALSLYRRLMAMPKSQGLPPKDLPRLYTQMGASLRLLGQFTESLEIIEEGRRLYPDYRPLRAYHMFALHSAGFHQNAMIESLQLMLESLGPTKWDLYEEDILHIVKDIRGRIPAPDTSNLADWEFDEYWSESGEHIQPADDEGDEVTVDDVLDEATAIVEGEEPDDTPDEAPSDEDVIAEGKITVDDKDSDEESFEIQVKVIDKDSPKAKSNTKQTPKSKKTKTSDKDTSDQFGKKPVKIDIGDVADADADEDDTPAAKTKKRASKKKTKADDDDSSTTTSGKVNIPIDFD